MKNRKQLFIIIGLCFIIFFSFIAYWTIIPRHGIIEYEGEGMYTGQLRGMTFHGYGTWISYEVKGVTYEGEWKDGMYHGQGTLTFFNGSQIVGEFRDGYLTGMGKSISADGFVREVNYDEIIRHDHSSECDHVHTAECDHDH